MQRNGLVLGLTSVLAEMSEAETPPSPPQYYWFQRRGARVRLREPVPVRLHLWDARLVDISLSGAFVEHHDRVLPREVYRLSFHAEGRPVQLHARVIRSFVSQLIQLRTGEGRIVYRTGMEFVAGENGIAEIVSAYIDQKCRRAYRQHDGRAPRAA